jgi:hypothetical protein
MILCSLILLIIVYLYAEHLYICKLFLSGEGMQPVQASDPPICKFGTCHHGCGYQMPDLVAIALTELRGVLFRLVIQVYFWTWSLLLNPWFIGYTHAPFLLDWLRGHHQGYESRPLRPLSPGLGLCSTRAVPGTDGRKSRLNTEQSDGLGG